MLVAIAIAIAGYETMLTALQRYVIFPRHLVQPDPDPGAGVEGLERWWLSTTAGRVEAWFLPAPGASRESPAPLALFAHGNAELIDHWPQALAPLRRLGFSVLLPEYRGYGRSAGNPSQRAITADFIEIVDRATARGDVDGDRVLYIGRSLGGGVVCSLAAQRPPRALTLMSTFSSLRAMARRYLLFGFLVRDPFDNLQLVSTRELPLLLVHGRRDRLIPVAHAEKLHAAASHSRLLLYDADHNDCPPDWSAFYRELRSWAQQAGLLRR